MKRLAIIQNLAQRLEAADLPQGTRVYTDPAAVAGLGPQELPAILVRPDEEAPREAIETGEVRKYRRVLSLKLEALAVGRQGQPLERILAQLDQAMEATMQADETHGGLASETLWAGSQFAFWGEGGEVLGAIVQTYHLSYQFPD